jgi:hypothetical protein
VRLPARVLACLPTCLPMCVCVFVCPSKVRNVPASHLNSIELDMLTRGFKLLPHMSRTRCDNSDASIMVTDHYCSLEERLKCHLLIYVQ